MKKLKKMTAVCAYCMLCAIAMNTSNHVTSEVWGVIGAYANGWKANAFCISANVATDIGIYYMLLGTGATGPAGLAVGVAATI